MRILTIAAAAITLSLSTIASASMNFADIDWLSSSKQVSEIMKKKGYVFSETTKEAGAVDWVFSGKLGTADAGFMFRFTKNDELVLVTIVTDELTDVAQVYQSLRTSLSKKYGDFSEEQDKRSVQFSSISSQTQLSQGIRLGEIYWSNRWDDDDNALEMETLKGGFVRLDYFSEFWNEEYKRRREGEVDDL